MSRSAGSSTHPTTSARLFRSFAILTLVLYAGYLVSTFSDSSQNFQPHPLVGGILAASSILLAWLAKLAWGFHTSRLVRVVLVLALVYQALFGVVMLVSRTRTEVTSNDDLVMLLWPHVVHVINSFE